MISKQMLLGLTLLALHSISVESMADVQIGNITIKDDGKIVFSDNSEQATATVKGDTGPKGDKGDPGTPGSQVTKDAMCQVHSTEGLGLPPFCARKLIFLTSQKFDGNLGGLTGADAKCEAAATSGGLSGTFKAWLSSSTLSAKDRLTHNPSPYVRTDGATVANNWFDLADGNLKDSILCDEYKNCSTYLERDPLLGDTTQPTPVFTGSSITGKNIDFYNQPNLTLTPSHFCEDWTSNASGRPAGGFATSVDSSWTNMKTNDLTCNIAGYRLYCLEQ